MAVNDSIDRINIGGDERMIKPGAENVRVSNVPIGGEYWTPGNVQTALENLRNYVKDNATQIAELSGKTDLVFGSLNNGIFYDINGNEAVRSATLLYIDRSTGIIYRWGTNSFEQVGGKDLGEYSLKNVPFLENPDTSNPDVFNIYKTYEDYVAWLRDHSASRLMSVAELLAYLEANIGQYVLALDAASSPEYVQRLSVAGGIAGQSSATTYIELRSYDNSPGLKISFSIDRTATNTGTTLTAERSTGLSTASYNGNTKVNEVSIAPAGVLTKLANGTTTNYILPSSSGTLALQSEVAGKQDALVSGQNIKSINGQSVLGAGNMTIHEEQLIEKSYAPAEFSGLGRKYLQKNIVSDKNVLTQAMMQDANTIYVIQYDYDLNGQSVTIPSGCTLQFEGGSLKNGTLIGNGCHIADTTSKIFDNVTIKGFILDYIDVRWFGAVAGDTTHDAAPYFQKALNCCANYPGLPIRVIGTYLIASSVECNYHFQLIGNNYVTRAFRTGLPESTVVESQIIVANNTTAFVINGYDTGTWSYCSFKISNIKFAGNDRSSALFEIRQQGAPGRPCAIHECDISFFDKVLYVNTDGNTTISVVTINGCNIYHNNSVIVTSEQNTSSISELDIYDNVIEQQKDITFKLFNPGANIYIHNNLLEGSSDWLLYAEVSKQCIIDISKNSFEANRKLAKVISNTELFSSNEGISNTRCYFRTYDNYIFTATPGVSSDSRMVLHLEHIYVSSLEDAKKIDFRTGQEDVTYFNECYFTNTVNLTTYPITAFGEHNCFEDFPISLYSMDYTYPTFVTHIPENAFSVYNGCISHNDQVFKRILCGDTNLNLGVLAFGNYLNIAVTGNGDQSTYISKTYAGNNYHFFKFLIEPQGATHISVSMKAYNKRNKSHNIIDLSKLTYINDLVYVKNNLVRFENNDNLLPTIQSDIPIKALNAKGEEVFWDGKKWNFADGMKAVPRAGTTAQRPDDLNVITDAGLKYFDTDLKKEIAAIPNTVPVDTTIVTAPKSKTLYVENPFVDGKYVLGFTTHSNSYVNIWMSKGNPEESSGDLVKIINKQASQAEMSVTIVDAASYPWLKIENKDIKKDVVIKILQETQLTWLDFDGAAAGVKRNGATSERPASGDIYVGFQYWDTDLGKMIAWNGSTWVNLDGTALT